MAFCKKYNNSFDDCRFALHRGWPFQSLHHSSSLVDVDRVGALHASSLFGHATIEEVRNLPFYACVENNASYYEQHSHYTEPSNFFIKKEETNDQGEDGTEIIPRCNFTCYIAV